jgi:hypothetical protein
MVNAFEYCNFKHEQKKMPLFIYLFIIDIKKHALIIYDDLSI